MSTWTEIEPWGPHANGDSGGDWQVGESWNRRWYRPAPGEAPGRYLVIDETVYECKSPDPEFYSGPPEHYVATQTELYITNWVADPERITVDDLDQGLWQGTIVGKVEDVEVSEDGARSASANHRQPLQHTWNGERVG